MILRETFGAGWDIKTKAVIYIKYIIIFNYSYNFYGMLFYSDFVQHSVYFMHLVCLWNFSVSICLLFWIGGGNKVIDAFMRIYLTKPALIIIVAEQNWFWFCLILPKKIHHDTQILLYTTFLDVVEDELHYF